MTSAITRPICDPYIFSLPVFPALRHAAVNFASRLRAQIRYSRCRPPKLLRTGLEQAYANCASRVSPTPSRSERAPFAETILTKRRWRLPRSTSSPSLARDVCEIFFRRNLTFTRGSRTLEWDEKMRWDGSGASRTGGASRKLLLECTYVASNVIIAMGPWG